MITGTTYQQRIPEDNENSKFVWVVTISIAFVMGLAMLGIYLTPQSLDKNPKVGDVWEFYSSGDPFYKETVYLRKVIAIKKGYIQFVENERDTLSRPKAGFMYNSKMISRMKRPIVKKIDTVQKPVEIIKIVDDSIK